MTWYMRLARRSPLWLLLVVLCFAVAAPLIALVGMAVVRKGQLTGAVIVEAFTSPGVGASLLNSAILMIVSTVFAAVLGSLLALAASKLDVRGRSILQSVPLVPLTIAPLVGTIGWVFLLDPRSGWINVGLTDLSHGKIPAFNVYSLPGAVIVLTLYITPFVFAVMFSAFERTSIDIFEAYLMNGSGRIGAFVRVTGGVLRPALLAACILAGLETMVQFAVPLLLNVNVLNVQIYQFAETSFPQRTDLASALAVIILVLAGSLTLVEYSVLRRGAFTTVSGRVASHGSWSLGKAMDRVIIAITFAYLLLAVVLPLAAIILVSFLRFWQPHLSWSDFTLSNYTHEFQSLNFLSALGTSIRLALVGSTIVVAVALTAVLSRRSKNRIGQVLYVAGNLPLGIPAIVLGLGFLIAFTDGPVKIYGTVAALLVGYVVLFLPFGLRSLAPSAGQLHKDLGDAARVSRANGFRTFVDVTAPLLSPAIASCFAISFIMMLREFPLSVLLSSPTTTVAAVFLNDTYQNGVFPSVAVMALFLSAVSAAAVVVQQLVRRQVRLGGGHRPRRRLETADASPAYMPQAQA